jgi:hypothetical protein
VLALVPLASLFRVLAFLLVAYLRGGKDDMKAAADAVQKVCSTVGVAAIDQFASERAGRRLRTAWCSSRTGHDAAVT